MDIELANICERRILDKLEFNGNYNKVFIYIVNLSSCKQNITQFWECLSVEERNQAKKYYTTNLSDRYIISHGMLRYILSYNTLRLIPYSI